MLLLLVDASALVVSVGLAYLLWSRPVHNQPVSIYLGALALLPLFLLSYALSGLYPGFGIGAVETLRRLEVRTTFVFIVIAATSFAFKLPHVYSRMTFGIAWLLSLLLVPLARLTFLKLAHRWRWWCEPALVVGGGRVARHAVRSLRAALSIGYRLAVVVDDEADEGSGAAAGAIDFAELSRRGLRIVLLADQDRKAPAVKATDLTEHFRHVIHLRDYMRFPVEGVVVRNLGGVLGIEFNNRLLMRRNRILKRTVDIVVGGVAFVLSIPVIAVAAALVQLASRGPVFFRQEREGLGGRIIRVYKLRTMHVDADARLDRHLEENPRIGEEWRRRFKLERDPRVVPFVGSLLRRLSLDELPQLLQVVTGDMTLVGPRPFPPYHLAHFDEEFLALRRRVRPGLTGLWQVMIRGDGGIEEQRSYDAYYIRNWSLWLDLYILARTVTTVVGGRGAY